MGYKRKRRYKASGRSEKYRREREFTLRHQEDSTTGLSRGKGDTGRSGLHGGLIHQSVSLKCNWVILKSRCPPDCPICKGREPGCQGGLVRRQKKIAIYLASVEYAKQELRKENDGYKRHLVFFRTLAYLHYLRAFTFSFRNPSRVFFSLYYQNLTVQRNPSYPVKWVAFQNPLDSSELLDWKREKRCIVLSPNQRKTLMCLGGSAKFLGMHLVSDTQRCEYLRTHLLGRLFGPNSFGRLIKAGGLDPNRHTHQCCSKSYFGE